MAKCKVREAKPERLASQGQFAQIWKRLRQSPSAMIGLSVFSILAFVAIFADFIVPYQYDKIDVLNAFAPPSAEHWCGTDMVGRDIFSRLIVLSLIHI